MAEYFRQQGFQLGLQQAQVEIVKLLYKKLCDIDLIADVTNLNIEEVKKILKD